MGRAEPAASASADSTLHAAFTRHQAGDFERAEELYQCVLENDPDNLNALQLTGLLLHQRGRCADAVALLQQAVAVLQRRGEEAAQHAALYNNLGNALQATGRGSDAVAQYRHGLDLDPRLAELHRNLGNTLLAQGDFTGAIASYETARSLGPLDAKCLHNLAGGYALTDRFAEARGILREALARSPTEQSQDASEQVTALFRLTRILMDKRQAEFAVEACRGLVSLAPNDAKAHYLLGQALVGLGDHRAATAAFRRCLELNPEHVPALRDLAATLAKLGLFSVAVPLLEMAIELQPNSASLHADLGNLLNALGNSARAHGCFRRVAELRPITTWPAAKRPPDLSVLAIMSPGAGNTPPDFLLGNASLDRHFFALLPDVAPDIEFLRAYGDIAINLISDVDQGHRMLALAADLFDQLGKPAFNHPRKILATDREAVAQRLSGIPLCRVPRTIRCTRDGLAASDAIADLRRRGIASPLLLRVVGTHGGDAFEKIDSAGDITAFLQQYPGREFYATEYVDYRSDDGYFRKYRYIFTNGEILPYHLAIADQWKVHHFRTDMGRHPWMQHEEQAFLEHPDRVFLQKHYSALRAIDAALDLDFFGIDCSLDREGNVVVFEVNASMLIHDDNADFPYKTPHCRRIRESFEAALKRAAGR
jgi:tetratricopeptide (TPR) repeat protein